MKKVLSIAIILLLCVGTYLYKGTDAANHLERRFDTALGGDYTIEVIGTDKVYQVKNGKVTSVPEKGYYVFYPEVNGKETLVQTPIGMTIITKVD